MGRDGAVGDLPLTMALARLPSLQGARAFFGQPLPYDKIDADLTIQNGILGTDNLELQGPELRLMAAGTMDLLSEAIDSNILLAIMLLQTVDRMIETLPIVRDLVLGEDGNLLAVYVRLEGPRDDLEASLVAPASLRKAGDITSRVVGNGVAEIIRIPGFGDNDGEPEDETGQGRDP